MSENREGMSAGLLGASAVGLRGSRERDGPARPRQRSAGPPAAQLPDILPGAQPNNVVGRRNTAKQVRDDDRNQILPASHGACSFPRF